MDSRAPPPPKTFDGVRFVLLGFDPVNERQIRSKLIECGGVDVGVYSPNCTHIIVDRITFDHPVCVAARKEGKTVVTALWVHHSFDVGMSLDPASVIYRPLKQLNGIPGAKNLIMCLTGYQGQDRDDIMTMVSLMGAQFSKPLVASKVTHLICYKFEGEKYKLAKQLRQIKIVNHRWLEDCLRDWVLLQEDNYKQSGYELEITGAEARDSEDEAEETGIKQSVGRSVSKNFRNMQAGSPVPFHMVKLEADVPTVPRNSVEKSISRNEASRFSEIHVSKVLGLQNGCNFEDAMLGQHNNLHHTTPDSKMKDDMTSTSRSAERPAPPSDRKSPAKSYNLIGKSLTTDVPSSLETGQDENVNKKSPLFTFHRSRMSSMSSKCGIGDLAAEESTPTRMALQNQQRDVQGLSPRNIVSVTNKSHGLSNLDLHKVGTDNLIISDQKKQLSKKTPKLTSANHEIPVLLDEHATLNIPTDAPHKEKSPTAIKCDLFSPDINAKALKVVEDPEVKAALMSGDVSENKIDSLDDETEPPEEDQLELEDICKEKTIETKASIVVEEKSEGVQHTLNISSPSVHAAATASGEDMLEKEQGKALSVMSGSTSNGVGHKRKKHDGVKRLLGNTKLKTVPAVTDDMILDEGVCDELLKHSDPCVNSAVMVPERNMLENERGETFAVQVKSTLKGDSHKGLKNDWRKRLLGKTKLKSVPARTDKLILDNGVSEELSKQSDPCVNSDSMAPEGNMLENEQGETVAVQVESTSKGDSHKVKKNDGRKRSLGKTKLTTVSAIADKLILDNGVSGEFSKHFDPCVNSDSLAPEGSMQEKEQGETVAVQVESTSKGDSHKVKKNDGSKRSLGKNKLTTVPVLTDKLISDNDVSEEFSKHSDLCVNSDSMVPGGNVQENEQGETVVVQVQSTSKGSGGVGKKSGKKGHLVKAKLKTVPTISDKMNLDKSVSGDVMNHFELCVRDKTMATVENKKGIKQESVSMLAKMSSKEEGAKEKKNSGRKRTMATVENEKGIEHESACMPVETTSKEEGAKGKKNRRKHTKPTVENEKGIEQEESVSMLVEMTSKEDDAKAKGKNNVRKRPLGRSKLNISSAVTETGFNEATMMEDEGRDLKCHNARKIKPVESSVLEETRPIACRDQNISSAKEQIAKSHVKCNFTPTGINQKLAKISRNSSVQEVKASDAVKTQPVWFILSGHQLERKELQKIIKRLKGRCCRDSHNWSYQATHFICPEPIRRIEKFFAAAASGRWILRSDYIADSNQAGKFVAEEPYEWYKKGLSEDGTINLEAPRKWRLLKERTGHGALYGMHIVIYGDCIAPRLDTLKRVMKAGDGTILATCPPYTRFLNSQVDFAIISPGMPRVDMWVQEFLKHEIPCVAADYLVEYVCKPGYSLERHVLYNTHAWAKKSFSHLQSKAEEVLVVVDEEEEETPTEDACSDDIACVVCGSSERGDVMLICGNENGSVGCGIGTHIDCCSPPLDDIPEGDWFCPKCSDQTRNTSNPSKKRKQGKSR